MSEGLPYKVGKGKPPIEHQFKKGQRSPNPHGRGKARPIDVVAFFDEPVVVLVDGKNKKLSPFEIALTNLAERVIKKHCMRSAAKFLQLCTEAGLLIDPDRNPEVPTYFQVSSAWEYSDWEEHFMRLGHPPWPGPRDGLYHEHWREEVLAYLQSR